MHLYLVRHGEANPAEADPSRGLSPGGMAAVKKTGTFLKSAGLRVDHIFHSGKTRAAQTATVLGSYVEPGHGIFPVDGLNPGDDPGEWANRLATEEKDIVIVGHLPHLARLCSFLLCNNMERTVVNFKAGQVVCLDRSADRWCLEWAINPDIIP